jgi:uncharacterized membrane protein
MRRSVGVAITFSLILFGLLLIPLDGKIDNTFMFFLGRFHPIILHLPIGTLMVLFFMEIINYVRPQLNLDNACNILLWFSVFSIIPTIVLGFLLGSSGSYDDDLLNTHKWLGWFTALTCIWLIVLRQKKSSKNTNEVSSFYKTFLFSSVILLSLAGHYGGYLTHGEDYLTKYMPVGMKRVLNLDDGDKEYLVINKTIDSTSKEALYYKNHIQPIIKNYCYECHGEKKQKGEMRLDTLNWNMINGTDAERWHSALNVINLGEMPPKKKPQLKDIERRALVDWLSDNLKKAAIAKQSDNQSVMRRLTKVQYTNSLNELLGVAINFGDVLPDDGKSKMGFSNNGNILQTSALHIDYYQKIAREALDKIIVYGEKPESKRYRVSLGKNIGDGLSGAEFSGYQTAPIDNENILVDILDGQGKPITKSPTSEENEALTQLKNKIGIGMRGSASNRYSIVKEGMVLNSALPAKEVTPKSWQGPSPNLKLLIKEDFPRIGDFAFRVKASKGYNSLSIERLIDLRKDQPAKKSPKTININAKDIKKTKGFVLKNNRWLMPKEVATHVNTEFTYNIPKSGIYQIDLIHPYVQDELTPSYQLGLLGRKKEGIISRRLNLKQSQKNSDKIITPVTLAYLSKGQHKASIGGKFFVGFSNILITPIPEDDPLPKILEEEAKMDDAKYASVNPSMQVFAGSRTDDGMDYMTFSKPVEITAPMGAYQDFEFTGRLENLPIPLASNDVSGDLANILTVGLWNNHLVKESSLKGPPLLIKSVEFEAPYYPVWPPQSHKKIFFDSPNKNNTETYAEEIISRFMQRAFRRPLDTSELNRYMSFWNGIKDDFDRFEDGIKEVLIAVLCSPNFIYLYEPETPESEKTQDQFYLASQLSYFLWNSPPDETLIQLADEGDLEDELSEQIDRMIDSPKIHQLVNSFTYEWLRLDRHKSMDVNVEQYEDFTRFVKKDMFEETYSFVHHVLKNNLSILNFIDSDFAMLNQNLAEFYGIEGVKGNEFRPVVLKENEERGGLLSQGSFLSGHSDGDQAHPIKRAVWLKEKILGDHPPPPPPNVPELDPETPGFENLTLKEQLFLHRNKVSCMDCHRKIDPFGVVFENYDAVGRYRTLSNEKVIDTKSKLPDGTEIDGIQGIKTYILDLKKENFTKSLVKNLFAYAVGRDVGFADEEEINDIVEEVIDDDYRFKTVIEQIVLSPSFHKKEQSWFNKIVGR